MNKVFLAGGSSIHPTWVVLTPALHLAQLSCIVVEVGDYAPALPKIKNNFQYQEWWCMPLLQREEVG